MLPIPWITFDAPLLLAGGLALSAGAIGLVAFRRASAPLRSHVLFGLGLVSLALAAGGPRCRGDARQRVAVMVDLSASTRGAAYRDEATLRARIGELLPDQPHTVTRFGNDNGERTTWAPPPPDASAVLLFSDGRFDAPATAPPVYAVVDPLLEQPGDAAVTSLERRGEQLVIGTLNGGPPRAMAITGAKAATQPTAPAGSRTITVPAASDAVTNVAQLLGVDPWPENDALTLATPPPASSERWWVGDGAPGAEWRTFSPVDLPSDPAAYLAPSVVVLNNVAAPSIPAAQAQRLQQYVRDLGGGLLILGGDQAFAAGGYDGSILGALSPLASSPPAPAAHWIFLLDASGSMAGESSGRTRLATAVAAAREAIGQLPPSDLLSVGGFSDELRWWLRGKSVKDFALGDVPAARGPTNLDAALRSLVGSLDQGVANQIVLLTDGQVELPAGAEIAKSLKAGNARLHVFAVGGGPGLGLLRKLAEATGGTFAEETDGARWAAGVMKLLRQVSPRYWNTTPVDVRFERRLVALPDVTAPSWNRTWLKSGADELARTVGADLAPMAARANVGGGKVAAVALRPPDGHVEALAALVQSPPRDPRLKVSWRTGRRFTVDVDAADDTAAINGLSPTLVLSTPDGSGESFPVPQTGPGRYVLSLPAPRSSTLATLLESGRVIDRFAVAGRYPPEFDGIGNDRAALQLLAERTGGRVIEPGDRGPLRLWSREAGVGLTSYTAGAGALLVAIGLVMWRRQGR